jgi:hypothetical protein
MGGRSATFADTKKGHRWMTFFLLGDAITDTDNGADSAAFQLAKKFDQRHFRPRSAFKR